MLRALAAVGDRRTAQATRIAGQLPQLLEETPVEVRRLGLSLTLDLRDNLQRTLFYTGCYERAFLSFLRAQIGAGDVFVDVGAHIGLHTLTVARRLRREGDGRVIAFEPAPDTAATLRRNVAANGATNVQVIEAALSDINGQVPLYDRDHSGHDQGVRSLMGGADPAVATVAAMVFDEWAEQQKLDRLDMVKLDVEGGEYRALSGMNNTLRQLQPRLVAAETVDLHLRAAGVTAADIDELLRDAGYERHVYQFDENRIYRRMRR